MGLRSGEKPTAWRIIVGLVKLIVSVLVCRGRHAWKLSGVKRRFYPDKYLYAEIFCGNCGRRRWVGGESDGEVSQ